MKKNLITLLWVIGIIVVVNFLANEFFFRIDTTADRVYTLSDATKNVIKSVEEPMTITAYFTDDLPQQYAKGLSDFKDLLKEYSTRSIGTINYEFVSPNDSPEKEQEAMQSGIQPLLINDRNKDEVIQMKAFMGAILKQGDRQEIIPFVNPSGAMEYQLTTTIKKLSVADKPSVAFIQGLGCPSIQDLPQVNEALGVLYNIESVTLNEEIPAHNRAVILLNPSDSIPLNQFQFLENYMANGGKVCVAFNALTGNFQTVQGEEVNNGVKEWLATKGINVQPAFVMDANCGAISVQQKQGFFSYSSQIEFPYFPLINKFEEHPITKGLDQMMFQFASPITYDGKAQFTPLIKSSERSLVQSLPVMFDVQRKWTARDFPGPSQVIGAVFEGDLTGTGAESDLVVFTDGDFPIGGGGRSNSNADNYSLLVNAVDWLSDDTGLIDLRTKGVTSRPIEELEDGKKSLLKWGNFLLPLILVALLGFFRTQKAKSVRMKRMQERYV